MSHTTGAVLIFADEHSESALSTKLVSQSASLLDVPMAIRRSPMGFVVATLRVPTRRFTSETTAAEVVAAVRNWLGLGTEAGALLGFVTRFEHHLENDFLQQDVLVPILAEDWDDLIAESWEWFEIGAPLFGRVTRDPDWVEAARTAHGVLYQRSTEPNPWATGGAA